MSEGSICSQGLPIPLLRREERWRRVETLSGDDDDDGDDDEEEDGDESDGVYISNSIAAFCF